MHFSIAMDDESFGRIKDEYDEFYSSLLRKGRLPMWSTQKGFWNAAISSEVYETFKKIELNAFKNFIDLGSGDGKVVLIASLFCDTAEGVEADDFLHNKSIEVRDKLGIKNAVFHNKDIYDHAIGNYDLIFLNPDAPLERGIEKKLLSEMKGKLLLYGHHFPPRFLKKEQSFAIGGTLISVYTHGQI